MSDKFPRERRRHERLNVELPVTIRYNGRLIPATALNLSCGGVQLDAKNVDLEKDGKVELVVDLSAHDTDVSLRGEVAWAEVIDQKTRLGIKFTNLFAVGHEAVQRYLRKHGVN